jgi:hypothetical protein
VTCDGVAGCLLPLLPVESSGAGRGVDLPEPFEDGRPAEGDVFDDGGGAVGRFRLAAALSTRRRAPVIVSAVIVYAILDLRSSPDHPLGDAIEIFIRREDAERSSKSSR